MHLLGGMYSYDRTAATLNQGTLDKLQKEFRLLTKIYRSVEVDRLESEKDIENANESWDEAAKIFRNWRESFREFLNHFIPPKKEGYPVTDEGWDLHYKLDGNELFPIHYPSRQKDFSALRHRRETNIKRYQMAATKFFKSAESWLYGREIQREDAVKHFEVSGVGVTILNQHKASEESTAHIDPYLRGLKDKVNDIRRAGFGKAVDGLNVTVNFEVERGEGLTNAIYNPQSDKMTMLPLGLIQEEKGLHRTFTHEIGHRFYFRVLPIQARNHWEETMSSQSVKITDEDVDRFTDLVTKKVEQSTPSNLGETEDRLRFILPHARDAAEEAKFRELSNTSIIAFFGGEAYSRSGYIERVRQSVGESVQIEEISEYANTSPMEAFAECFWMYVLKGPRSLGPWTRSFFERICLAGGAKLASMKTGYTSVFAREGSPTYWPAAEEDFQKFNALCALVDKKPTDRARVVKAIKFIDKSVPLYSWLTRIAPESEHDEWLNLRRPLGALIKDPNASLEDLTQGLDALKNKLRKIFSQTAPAKFSYSGFQVSNQEHFYDEYCRKALAGFDFLRAVFKKRGVEKLIGDGIKQINLVIDADGATAYFNSRDLEMTISVPDVVKRGAGRFLDSAANETILHEFGHFVHLNYIRGEAKEAWDQPWGKHDTLPRGDKPSPERKELLDNLEVVTEYGRSNSREDFAETFMMFMAVPEKLTPTAKFRMEQALSLTGLYGKPVMRLASKTGYASVFDGINTGT